MRARGKVLREPDGGPGLLMIDGQQFRFWLSGWHSEIAPRPGLAVDVELNRQLEVVRVTAIPEAHEKELAQTPASQSTQEPERRRFRLLARILARLTGALKKENPAA